MMKIMQYKLLDLMMEVPMNTTTMCINMNMMILCLQTEV